jgi:hypothetical protein
LNAARESHLMNVGPGKSLSRTSKGPCPARLRRPGLERLDDRLLLSDLPPLTAHPGPTTSAFVGGRSQFHATFNDPAPGLDRVVIDWGDGTSSSGLVSTIDYAPGATGDNHGIYGDHVYTDGGSYTITATILGSGGAVGQVTGTVNLPFPYYLSAPAPTPASGPILSLFQSVAPFGTHNPDLATADVTGLYNTILGRAPDPAGLASAVAAMNTGVSATEIASALLHSVEYETGVVASYYQNDLGRGGSQVEVAGWVSLMQGGMTAERVSSHFLSSSEFNALHPDSNSFVVALYENVLERPPAPWEIAEWSTALDSGMSRATTVADFLGSPEAASRSVRDFYKVFLEHAPDPASLQADVAALLAGATQADLAAAIAGLSEFMSGGKGTVAS